MVGAMVPILKKKFGGTLLKTLQHHYIAHYLKL
jgi:hypothetical protein